MKFDHITDSEIKDCLDSYARSLFGLSLEEYRLTDNLFSEIEEPVYRYFRRGVRGRA